MAKKQTPEAPASSEVTVAGAAENLKRAAEQLDESREFLARDEAVYAQACAEFDEAVAMQRKRFTR